MINNCTLKSFSFLLVLILCLTCSVTYANTSYSLELEKLFYHCNKVNSSISTLKKNVLKEPKNALLRYQLGKKYLSKRQGIASLSQLNKAKALGFIYREINLDIAESLFLQGQYNSAFDHTKEYLSKEPLLIAYKIRALLLKGKSELHLPHYDKNLIIKTFTEVFRELNGFSPNKEICENPFDPVVKWKIELAKLEQKHQVVKQASDRVRCLSSKTNNEKFVSSFFDFSKLGTGKTHRVGLYLKKKRPSKVVPQVKDGDIVEIETGTYESDVTVWPQNNLTIRSIGGITKLDAKGKSAGGKGIWVFKGNNVLIEGFEFSNSKSKPMNSAGIRAVGGNLYIKNCIFQNNQMGILTSHNPESNVIIESSEFYQNTVDYETYKRLGHNIYIGKIGNFVLLNSYSHDAAYGHLVKTLAHNNYIIGNYLSDGKKGKSSYAIDMPKGGNNYIIGNIIEQSAFSENYVMISFAATNKEKLHQNQSLNVINNTLINNYVDGVFINNRSKDATLHIVNNIFYGVPATQVKGKVKNSIISNNINDLPNFVDYSNQNYRLLPSSKAIDHGITIENFIGKSIPILEYNYPNRIEYRKIVSYIDVGAIEYCEK